MEIPGQGSTEISPLVSPAAGSHFVAREQGFFGGRPKVSQEPLLKQFLQSFLLSSLCKSVLQSVF